MPLQAARDPQYALEQCVNYIAHSYNTTYTAIPLGNLGFLNWDACPSPAGKISQLPVREIYSSFAQPFFVGKTYTLEGMGLSAGLSFVSIQITRVDINANFAGFAQCVVTETQSPKGTPTRRKTYCPRFDGTYEIKENVLADLPAASNAT